MENGKGNGYHWDSDCEVLSAEKPDELAKLIRSFCKGRFVVGVQVFPAQFPGLPWRAFVYFKVRASENSVSSQQAVQMKKRVP